MADYAKLKKLHPRAKVRRIKRLISELRKMIPMDLAHERSRIDPPKIGGRKVTLKMAANSLASVESLGKSNVPISFGMGDWLASVPIMFAAHADATCGTSACIAGLAGVLAAREPKAKANADLLGFLKDALRGDDCDDWVMVLAEYLGVDHRTACSMTQVSRGEDMGVGPSRDDFDYNRHVGPRHAVRLLEKFLDSGKVDWIHAMGRNSKTRELTQKERKMRVMEEKQFEAAFNEADAVFKEAAAAWQGERI